MSALPASGTVIAKDSAVSISVKPLGRRPNMPSGWQSRSMIRTRLAASTDGDIVQGLPGKTRHFWLIRTLNSVIDRIGGKSFEQFVESMPSGAMKTTDRSSLMKIETFVTNRMVKGEDLNHHGTLFAGRSAQWFVEAGFIAAANLTRPENILCLKIHGMLFKKPIKMGSVIRYESKIVHTGRTSLVAHIRLFLSHDEAFLLEGFITFIHVDEKGRPIPHNITLDAVDNEDIALQERATALH